MKPHDDSPTPQAPSGASGKLGDIRDGFLWIGVDRVFRLFLSLGVMSLFARYIGPVDFGALSYALTIVLLLAPVASLALETQVTRDLSAEPHRRHEILGTYGLLRLVTSILALGVATSSVVFVPAASTHQWIVLSVSWLLVVQPLESIELWFQSQRDVRNAVLARICSLSFGAMLKLGLVLAGASFPWFVGATVLDGVLLSAALLVAYQATGESITRWTWSPVQARLYLSLAWPLMGAALLSSLFFRLEQFWVMESYEGTETAGAYYAALRIGDFGLVMGSSLAALIMPVLARRAATRCDSYVDTQRATFEIMTLAGYALAIAMTLLAIPATSFLLGPAYRETGPILMVRAWIMPFVFSGLARSQMIILRGGLRSQAVSSALSLAVICLGTQPLLAILGAPGAALTLVIGFLAGSVVSTWLLPSLRPCWPDQLAGFLILVRPRRACHAVRLLFASSPPPHTT